jgi:hypothetical protein
VCHADVTRVDRKRWHRAKRPIVEEQSVRATLVSAPHISQRRRFVPVLRYLLFTGSALLALLFLADWYWPTTTTTVANGDQVQETSIDRDILRIRSAQRWPQKVVFDTNLPTIVPPQAVANVPPPAVAMPVVEKPALTAFAEMKPAAQPQGLARKAVVKHRASRPAPARVAAYPTAPAWSWNW